MSEDVKKKASPPAHPTVHEAIGRVILDMAPVGKDQFNQQQRFAFRGIDDVLASLKPVLGRHGVFLVPAVVERHVSERTTKSGGLLYVVDLPVCWRVYGPAGDWIEAGPVWGQGTDSGDKATQKALTGAFKYLLFELFCVAGASEADSDHGGNEETVRRPQAPPPDPALEEARARVVALSEPDPQWARNKWSELYPERVWSSLTLDELSTLALAIEARPEAAGDASADASETPPGEADGTAASGGDPPLSPEAEAPADPGPLLAQVEAMIGDGGLIRANVEGFALRRFGVSDLAALDAEQLGTILRVVGKVKT